MVANREAPRVWLCILPIMSPVAPMCGIAIAIGTRTGNHVPDFHTTWGIVSKIVEPLGHVNLTDWDGVKDTHFVHKPNGLPTAVSQGMIFLHPMS